MRIPKPQSRWWDTGNLAAVFGIFYWRMRVNASDFDDTELVTIGEALMWTFGIVATIGTIRAWGRAQRKRDEQ